MGNVGSARAARALCDQAGAALVLDEVRAWQERPLEAIYPVLWLDGGIVDRGDYAREVFDRDHGRHSLRCVAFTSGAFRDVIPHKWTGVAEIVIQDQRYVKCWLGDC